MAKVVEDYLQGSARKAERVLGWKRQSVQLGLNERRTGIVCVDNYGARGRHKSEVILPNLEADIRSLVNVQAQADPKFQSTEILHQCQEPILLRTTAPQPPVFGWGNRDFLAYCNWCKI